MDEATSRGFVNLKLGRADNAIDDYGVALSLDPKRRRFSVRRLRRAQKIATAEREFRLGLLRSTETGKNKEAARREIRSDGRPLASLLDGVVDEGVGLLSLILRLSTMALAALARPPPERWAP